MAVDLVTTGNTATNIGSGGAGIDAGDIQSSLGSVAIGSTLTFDIVVDSVPSPGMFATGLEVNYDPTIARITGESHSDVLHYSAAGAIPFATSDSLPDTDGSFRVDHADLGGNDETGPGRVLRVTIECIAAGTTPITLTDSFTGGGANAGILNTSSAFTIGTEIEASIDCTDDTDGDGVLDDVDNCPNWYNPTQELPPWPVPPDDQDCDGFDTTTETFVGTVPTQQCALTSTANDESLPDMWPVDFNDDKFVNLFDLIPYIGALNTAAPGPPYAVRLDLNASGDINLFDLIPFISMLNKACTP